MTLQKEITAQRREARRYARRTFKVGTLVRSVERSFGGFRFEASTDNGKTWGECNSFEAPVIK